MPEFGDGIAEVMGMPILEQSQGRTFNGVEQRLILGMSLLAGIRALGVSMIMPVFSFYALSLSGATEQWVGIAMGIFAISQMFFQIPMGYLSDHLGRKTTTIIGSLIYLLGTFLCGLAGNIYFLILARSIAGAGAVTGVAMTWMTESVNKKSRNKSMAYMGTGIGMAVIIGFPLSWFITSLRPANYVFYVCAFFLILALVYTIVFMEDGNHRHREANQTYNFDETVKIFKYLIRNGNFLRLSVVGFGTNVCFAGVFYIMPILILGQTQLGSMWKIFAPTALIGTVLMFYFARRADRNGSVQTVLIGLAFEFSGVLIPLWLHSIYFLIPALIVFYAGHCILASTLPVVVSDFPVQKFKGTVMSIFTSAQFLGMGLGSIVSGFILKFSSNGLFGFLSIMILCSLTAMMGYKSAANKGHENGDDQFD
jgi:MFS family permease